MQCKYNILFTGVWLSIKFLNTKFLLSMESITSHLVIKFEKAGTDDNIGLPKSGYAFVNI